MWIAELWISFFIAIQFGWWGFLRSPGHTYRRAIFYRDKILATVEMLQSESAKWKALFTTLKAPYTLLRAMGVSPNMAVTLLIGGSVATTGVVAAEIMEPPSFSKGHAGIYDAPGDAPIFFAEKFNTLRVDLGATSVGNITISDTTLGTAFTGSALPSGETSPIIIGGKPAVADPAFVETFLETSYLLVDRLSLIHI